MIIITIIIVIIVVVIIIVISSQRLARPASSSVCARESLSLGHLGARTSFRVPASGGRPACRLARPFLRLFRAREFQLVGHLWPGQARSHANNSGRPACRGRPLARDRMGQLNWIRALAKCRERQARCQATIRRQAAGRRAAAIHVGPAVQADDRSPGGRTPTCRRARVPGPEGASGARAAAGRRWAWWARMLRGRRPRGGATWGGRAKPPLTCAGWPTDWWPLGAGRRRWRRARAAAGPGGHQAERCNFLPLCCRSHFATTR